MDICEAVIISHRTVAVAPLEKAEEKEHSEPMVNARIPAALEECI